MADADIYARLKADHDRQRDLFARIDKAANDDRAALFDELRKELQAHAAAEEESLYATMLSDPELRDSARHSVSEHKEIDDMLGELVELETDDAEWLAKFKEMRHRYFHHIHEEEEEMFPEAAEALSGATEAKLARTYAERKPAELARAEEEQPGDARE